jgi:hypothetical protein
MRRNHPHPGRGRRTSAQLLTSGDVDPQQLYAAALVLAGLQDRGAAADLTIEEMCEVLGYTRRRKAVEAAP